jgi:hypothetical protein
MRSLILLVLTTCAINSFATPVAIEPTPFKGKVQHLSYNAEGKLAGVVLEDRTFIKFHAETLANSLAGAGSLKIGTEIEGTGQLTLTSPNKVFERVEIHQGAKKIIDDNIILAGTPNPGPTNKFKWMKVSSPLIAVSTRLNGQIDQLLLGDGTTVGLAKDAVLEPRRLHAGGTITVTGVGASFPEAKYVLAMTLSDSNHPSLLATWRSTEKWVLKEGTIKQPILNVQGDVEGLVLGDKTVILFDPVPFGVGSALISEIKIRVAGPASNNQMHVGTIYLVEDDSVLDAEPKPKRQTGGEQAKGDKDKEKDNENEKDRDKGKGRGREERANLQSPMDINGKRDGNEHAYGIPALARVEDTSRIDMILREPKGEIRTLLLRDGTTVSIPPQLRERVPAGLKVGDPVKVFGLGGDSALGSAMEAMGISRLSGSKGISD